MPEEKMDLLYRIAMVADRNIEQMIAAAGLLFLCRDFMWHGSGGRKKWTALLVGSVYFWVYMFLFSFPGTGSYFTSAVSLTAAFAAGMWADRNNSREKLFLFGTFLQMRWMALSISNTVSGFLLERIDRVISGAAGADDPSQAVYFYAAFCGYLFLGLLLFGVILFLMGWIIRRAFAARQRDMEGQEFLFLMIPIGNGMAAHLIFRVYLDAYEKETGLSLNQTYPLVEYCQMLYFGILLVSIVSMIVLNQRLQKKQEEERAQLLLESRMRDMQTHIAEVEKLYADIRGVKHDIKNHVGVIDSLLMQGKLGEAREYAQALFQTAEAFDFAAKTGNPVTDVLLREKSSAALEQNIRFTSDFHYPVDMGINAFDISVILSNALANAMEAAGNGGYVKLSSFRNKNAYLITVENSFDGSLALDPASGLPKTGKSDKGAHGLGMRNMRSVAAKYFGDVRIEQKGDCVAVTVLLLGACGE